MVRIVISAVITALFLESIEAETPSTANSRQRSTATSEYYLPPRVPHVSSNPNVSHLGKERLSALRQLGIYRMDGLWLYRTARMKDPRIVTQLPQMQRRTDGTYLVLAPAKIGNIYKKH